MHKLMRLHRNHHIKTCFLSFQMHPRKARANYSIVTHNIVYSAKVRQTVRILHFVHRIEFYPFLLVGQASLCSSHQYLPIYLSLSAISWPHPINSQFQQVNSTISSLEREREREKKCITRL